MRADHDGLLSQRGVSPGEDADHVGGRPALAGEAHLAARRGPAGGAGRRPAAPAAGPASGVNSRPRASVRGAGATTASELRVPRRIPVVTWKGWRYRPAAPPGLKPALCETTEKKGAP